MQRDYAVAGSSWRLETLCELDVAADHFGVVWPAALALCEHLQAILPARQRPLDVLELGCGLALPSLVARKLGARRVVATDRHPLVPEFLGRNAAANGVAGVEYRTLDWRKLDDRDLGKFDLVIGSDLLYEAWQPGFLAHLLPRLLRPGGQGVVADPGRRYVDDFVRLVEGAGGHCDLSDLRRVPQGERLVDVLIVVVTRDDGR